MPRSLRSAHVSYTSLLPVVGWVACPRVLKRDAQAAGARDTQDFVIITPRVLAQKTLPDWSPCI